MTFSYTDEQLNNLNRDYAVSSINLEFAKRNGRTYVNSNLIESISPDDLEKTNTITTSDGQEFRVVATKSDIETGFDGLAVAPIVNGKPDYKNVAVIAAGTDPDSPVNKTMFSSRDVNGISSSEEIYLDAAQGSILSSSMATAARTGADEVSALAKKANQELQEIWSKIDFTSYTALAPYEVDAIFASQGITQAQFIDTFQVQEVIEKTVATDKQLGKEFRQWKEKM